MCGDTAKRRVGGNSSGKCLLLPGDHIIPNNLTMLVIGLFINRYEFGGVI